MKIIFYMSYCALYSHTTLDNKKGVIENYIKQREHNITLIVYYFVM